jgi:ribosome-associated translation inhibitor RaiA
MSTTPSPTDATVAKCLDLGHGFHEDERETVLEVLHKIDHRLHGTAADRVQLILMVKDRDHNDQKITFEAHVAGVPTIVATAEDEDLWAGVAHVREEFLRQYNDWVSAHRR